MSRNIVSGVKAEPAMTVDDLLADSDEEELDAHDLRTQRNMMSALVSESWHAVEVAALSIPGEGMRRVGSVRSIGSRLGGLGDSIRGSPGPRRASFASPKHEKSPLLRGGGKDDEDDDGTEPESPPVMKWIWAALACAICYALYNISIKKGSATINPIMGGVILQFVAALLGTLLLSAMILDGKGNEIHHDRKGLLWSMAAGLWVGTAEMVSFVVSGMGVGATQFIPIIIGGSVMFGSVLGVLTLGESIMLHGWSGVAMLCVGIVMVATDPGEKVEEGGAAAEDNAHVAPPLAVWIWPALFCALAYALYNICIKKGSSSINPIVGAVILQFVAAIYGSFILLVLYINGLRPEYDKQGIVWACWAGLFVGAAELLSFCVSGLGVQASQSIPIIIGGSVGFGAVFGIVMLGEELEWQGWTGVVVLMSGIALVATDPGEKVQGH